MYGNRNDRRNPYFGDTRYPQAPAAPRQASAAIQRATPGAPQGWRSAMASGQPMGPKGPATGAAAQNAAWAANRPMGAASQWQNSGVGQMPSGLLGQPQQLWQTLSTGSSPYQIANAYNQWAGANGGNTAANQQTAQNYLQSIGVQQPMINQAYNAFLSGGAPGYRGFSNPYGGPEFFGGNN